MKAMTLMLAAALMTGPSLAFGQASTDPSDLPKVVTGEVIRYERGKVLVLRSEGKEVSYTIAPSLVVPSEVEVGKKVSVLTETDSSGVTIVSGVTTTTRPEGQTKRTAEERTTTTSVQGSVQSYQPGKSITVLRSDGSTKTFTISESAKLPAKIQDGKTVTILTHPDGSVETITVERE